MKKYLAIFNKTTLVLTLLSLISCYTCYYFRLGIYADFLILSLLVAFPLTLTIKEAFKRRERSLQYLSLFKGSLQSVFYSVQNSKIDQEYKNEFRTLATNLTDQLLAYLLSAADEGNGQVQEKSEAIAFFVNKHKKGLKGSLSPKILLFLFRLNESIEFLIATKRHHTPKTLRLIVLIAISAFAIFYPAALLNDVGFSISFWNLFSLTIFKVLLLISLYNVQVLLENPFDQRGTDGIRVMDFAFTAHDFPPVVKKEKAENAEDEEPDDLLD